MFFDFGSTNVSSSVIGTSRSEGSFLPYFKPVSMSLPFNHLPYKLPNEGSIGIWVQILNKSQTVFQNSNHLFCKKKPLKNVSTNKKGVIGIRNRVYYVLCTTKNIPLLLMKTLYFYNSTVLSYLMSYNNNNNI